LLELSDAIGPASSDFFVRSLRDAAQRQVKLLILRLDTPGGLDSAMREMIQAILASPVPVVVYVAPAGARAASAGTYLLYASHIAAMAPATSVGAATPVQVFGATELPKPVAKKDGEAEKPQANAPTDAHERKAISDAAAYIRGLAQLRGRNATWAEAAVTNAESLSSDEALKQHVIDLIAADVPELLAKIDGREVTTSTGKLTLATRNLQVETLAAGWRTQLLATLTNPNVAYILMLIGVYGLLLEGYNPGAVLPGVAGAICLLLALYAFQILAVNYAGLALMLLGLIMIGSEAFAPSGALALGGVIAFVIGSILLLDRNVPGFNIARPLIGAMATLGSLLALVIVTYAMRARRRPVVTGASGMLAEPATAVDAFTGSGLVRIHGELWQAHSREPVGAGEILRVVRINGLVLEVEK
jgi:membrane-bound serine protease (ClpP class)